MEKITTMIQAVMEAQAKTMEGGKMTMVMVKKQSASGLPTTMTSPTLSDQNTATPKATLTSIHEDLTFLSNTIVKHASGKGKYKKMMQQSITKLEDQNAIVSFTLTSEGVGGLIKRQHIKQQV